MLSPFPAWALRLLAMLGEQPRAEKPQALGLMAVNWSFLASLRVLVILRTMEVPFLTLALLAAWRVILLRAPAAKSQPRSRPELATSRLMPRLPSSWTTLRAKACDDATMVDLLEMLKPSCFRRCARSQACSTACFAMTSAGPVCTYGMSSTKVWI